MALRLGELHVQLDSVDLVDSIDSWLADADTLDSRIEVRVRIVAHILDSMNAGKKYHILMSEQNSTKKEKKCKVSNC